MRPGTPPHPRLLPRRVHPFCRRVPPSPQQVHKRVSRRAWTIKLSKLIPEHTRWARVTCETGRYLNILSCWSSTAVLLWELLQTLIGWRQVPLHHLWPTTYYVLLPCHHGLSFPYCTSICLVLVRKGWCGPTVVHVTYSIYICICVCCRLERNTTPCCLLM